MKKEYSKPTAEKLNFDYAENVVASGEGHGDVGRGRGHGGGCDGKPGHSNHKSFSNGNNSGC